jgi:hypothetical protein
LSVDSIDLLEWAWATRSQPLKAICSFRIRIRRATIVTRPSAWWLWTSSNLNDTVYDLASEANRHAVGADLYQLLHIFRQLKSATLQSGIQLGKVPNAEASGARGTLKTSQILVSVQYFEGEFAI